MQHAPSAFLGLISKTLRANYDEVAKEPLPQRWVDLIYYLNVRDRVETTQERPAKPPKRRSH